MSVCMNHHCLTFSSLCTESIPSLVIELNRSCVCVVASLTNHLKHLKLVSELPFLACLHWLNTNKGSDWNSGKNKNGMER